MSQENVETLRELVEAFNRGDFDAALERVHPDVEWRSLDSFPDAGTYRGADGVRKFFETWIDTFQGFRLHLQQCAAVDEHLVVATFRASGEGAGSGVEVESPVFVQLLEFRDGLMVRTQMFQTEHEALEAAGLSE
jgi:ketosteroid isomerase-like protein